MNGSTISALVALLVFAVLCGAIAVGSLLEAKKKNDKGSLFLALAFGACFVAFLWFIPYTVQDRNNEVKSLNQAHAELLGNYPEITQINELHMVEQTIVYRRNDGRSCFASLAYIKSARQHWVIDKHSMVCTVAK